jgi:hypothetical protein
LHAPSNQLVSVKSRLCLPHVRVPLPGCQFKREQFYEARRHPVDTADLRDFLNSSLFAGESSNGCHDGDILSMDRRLLDERITQEKNVSFAKDIEIRKPTEKQVNAYESSSRSKRVRLTDCRVLPIPSTFSLERHDLKVNISRGPELPPIKQQDHAPDCFPENRVSPLPSFGSIFCSNNNNSIISTKQT